MNEKHILGVTNTLNPSFLYWGEADEVFEIISMHGQTYNLRSRKGRDVRLWLTKRMEEWGLVAIFRGSNE